MLCTEYRALHNQSFKTLVELFPFLKVNVALIILIKYLNINTLVWHTLRTLYYNRKKLHEQIV